VIALAAAWLGGCGGPIYGRQSGSLPTASITDRATWQISGTLKNLPSAIDGDVATSAVSFPAGGNGVVTLDLGKPCVFNLIVVDHGPSEMGYAARLAVLTSLDGQKFTRRHVASGTRRVSLLNIVTPTLARYVRLQVVQPGALPWSVGDVYLQ